MNLELKDKIALITGSGYGLGLGICEAFLKEGAKVINTDIDGKKLERSTEKLSSIYGADNIFSFCGDLTNTNEIKSCIKTTLNHFSKIDILIANLGSGRGSTDWNITEEEWENMMNLNFNGARRIVNEIIPTMINQNHGSIIFISSIAGLEVIGAPIHYSVAKVALIAYSKNLSRKLAKYNIRVNTICPGNIYFENGTWDIKLKENKEKVLEMLKNSVPQCRFTTPEEIANLVLFISSNKLAFMTGSCIVMDGGQTVSI